MAKIIERIEKTKNGTEVLLTSPQAGDGENLLKCMVEIVAASEHLLSTPEEFKYTPEQEEDLIRSYLTPLDKVLITPKVKNEIVGMLDFSVGNRKRNSHYGEFGMSVHPKYQGQGIGRLMLEALIDWATKNPRVETLRLRVHAQNQKAIQFYRACGFKEEGREVDGVKLEDGRYDDVISMARFVR